MFSFEQIDSYDLKLDDTENKINQLLLIAKNIEQTKTLGMNASLEADRFIGDTRMLNLYFQSGTIQEQINKHQVAIEEISAGIVALVLATLVAIVALMRKGAQWLRGSGSGGGGGFTGTENQVRSINQIVHDQDVQRSIDDSFRQMEEAAQHNHGIAFEREDVDAVTTGIKIKPVFDSFKDSLKETEIDFLTSGYHYKAVKDIVDNFSHANFPTFVNGIGDDVTKWISDGLAKAPHVGKDEEVANAFIREEKKKLEDIKGKYRNQIKDIEELHSKCQNSLAKGSIDHLMIFYRKPSALFPHLQHLWSTIHFEKISKQDRDLINSLERAIKDFESTSSNLKNKLENKTRVWIAEDEMLRMANHACSEIASIVRSLLRAASFIKTASQAAYSATVKSFSYITKMLYEISKLPNIDRDRLNKSLDILSQKRKELMDIVKLD